MSRMKDCPGCGFRAGINARACARCGHFFPDVASVAVRRWVNEFAKREYERRPEVTRAQLREYLEEHLAHDPGLLRELSEPDPREVALGSPKTFLQVLADQARSAWAQLTGGTDPHQAAKIEGAIEGALDELFEGERESWFETPWG